VTGEEGFALELSEPLNVGAIEPVYAFRADNYASVFTLRLTVREGEEWPWGGTKPLIVALNRREMADFLGSVAQVAEQVYSAIHEQGA